MVSRKKSSFTVEFNRCWWFLVIVNHFRKTIPVRTQNRLGWFFCTYKFPFCPRFLYNREAVIIINRTPYETKAANECTENRYLES